MVKTRKAMSVLLAASMVMSVAACDKKSGGTEPATGSGRGSGTPSKSGEQITADMPWYEYRDLTVDIQLDATKEKENVYSSLVGADSEHVVYYTCGNYKIPDNVDWENESVLQSYMINNVTVIDRKSGSVVNNIDLNSYSELTGDTYVYGVEYAGGQIVALAYDSDPNSAETKETQFYIDPNTTEIIGQSERACNDDANMENILSIGDNLIFTYLIYDSKNDNTTYYELVIRGGDGTEKTVTFKADGVNIYNIPFVLPLNENTVIVPLCRDDDVLYDELNLETGETKHCKEGEYDWLDTEEYYKLCITNDGKMYTVDDNGILEINLQEKQTQRVFDFSCCNASFSDLRCFELVDVSDEGFLMSGHIYSRNAFEISNPKELLWNFTKCESNPHAGKTIMELYCPDYLSDTIGDAIIRFNETNSDYYLCICDRYDEYDYYDPEMETDGNDSWEKANLTANAEMSTDLALDIMNGEGPDILLDTSCLGQLNNPDYLVDLTPYIGDMNSDKYFTNIIESSKTEGKLYQMPITFAVEGLQADPKYAGSSGVGFTFDEYEKLLNETWNGTDTLNYGQCVYFSKLFCAESSKFIKNGKVDFSDPAFAAMADFVKRNVPEDCTPWDEFINEDVGIDGSGAAVGVTLMKGDTPRVNGEITEAYLGGMYTYLSNIGESHNATLLLGMPSSDGAGPLFSCETSFAISAQAENVDACAEFMKLLLSDEIQTQLAFEDSFVLNRTAFREAGEAAVEYFNSDDGGFIYSFTFTSEHVDLMEQNILNCSRMSYSDAAIILIVIEEMQPYFVGQKELDDVVVIAQDRIQTVINERG